MNRFHFDSVSSATRQTGTTLIVALILLLLASLLALYAVNVGLFAQRTSAADLRGRIVHETLEAGMAQGIEYIRNNSSTLTSTTDSAWPGDSLYWKPCDHTDTSFPCGAVPPCAAGHEGCASGSTYARRSNMYYYKNTVSTPPGAGYDVNGNGNPPSSPDAMDLNSLPIDSIRIKSSNGFSINYGVGALMCVVKKSTSSTDPALCTPTVANAQGTYLFTVAASGNIAGESASTTLSTSFGQSPSVSGFNVPAITASGGFTGVNGNAQVVTAPNAGGYGNPVSFWTRGDFKTNGAGTANSCYMEDWLRNSGGTYSFATKSDGTTSTVVTCTGNGSNACACSQSISSGNGQWTEGPDILTADGTPVCSSTVTSSCKPTYDVQPSEFPPDLFQYVFGISAWLDKNGDYFGETRQPTVSITVADGSSQTVNVDEAYLYSKAVLIYSPSHPTWPTAAQSVSSCTALVAATRTSTFPGGIVWDQEGDCLSGTVGWPDKPVAWVSDGSMHQSGTGTVVFGMIFVRDTSCPAGSSNGCTTSVGGAADFQSDGLTVYGSVVIQGTATKVNAGTRIIYNSTVMAPLADPWKSPASPLPGSWTDRYAY